MALALRGRYDFPIVDEGRCSIICAHCRRTDINREEGNVEPVGAPRGQNLVSSYQVNRDERQRHLMKTETKYGERGWGVHVLSAGTALARRAHRAARNPVFNWDLGYTFSQLRVLVLLPRCLFYIL